MNRKRIGAATPPVAVGVRPSKYGKRDTVVEKAIAKMGGSPQELARRLSEYADKEITRQTVHGWRKRGVFPRDMMLHVERLTGITIEELATAKPVEHDQGNIVNRAIRLLGADANPAALAARLSKESGRNITRQMVNNWQVTEQFPTDIVPFVHLVTRIPVRDLIAATSRSRPKKKG